MRTRRAWFLSIRKRQGHPLLPRDFAIRCIGRLGAIVSHVAVGAKDPTAPTRIATRPSLEDI